VIVNCLIISNQMPFNLIIHCFCQKKIKMEIKLKISFNYYLFIIGIILSLNTFAQSTSVFDANFFNQDNTSPPIKIGKGFHINDVYKQTKSCFTSESSGENQLTSQQSTNSAKTNIKLYYTKTNSEYNSFKSQGVSGKVSYLNLFSAGADKLNQFFYTEEKEEEKLIFIANYDFGMSSFAVEPILTNEAKELISQNKIQEFVNYYGTHYISGVRKESLIKVIISKSKSSESSDENNETSYNIGVKIPFKASASLEIKDKNNIENFLNDENLEVEIEINGPKIDSKTLKDEIKDIVGGSSPNKEDAIQELISNAAEKMSDPSHTVITQYYYSPFELLGVKGISWDVYKQNELSNINTHIIDLYLTKKDLDEWINQSTARKLIDEICVEEEIPYSYREQLYKNYSEVRSKLLQLSDKTNLLFEELKSRYLKCSDVFCNDLKICCNNERFLTELNVVSIDDEIEVTLESIFSDVFDELDALVEQEEENKPDCEKQNKGFVTFKNVSSNPYNLYLNGDFIQTIAGNSSESFLIELGTHRFKAIQKSGYLLYPTENIRNAIINNPCEEKVFKIGIDQ